MFNENKVCEVCIGWTLPLPMVSVLFLIGEITITRKMLKTQSFTWKWRHLQDDKIFHRNPCNFSQKSTEFVIIFQRHISCSEYLDFQRLQFHNEQDCCDQENWLYRLQIRCLHIRTHSKCRCQWSKLRRFATVPYGRHTGVIDSVRTRNNVILRVSSPDPAARTSTKPLRQPKIWFWQTVCLLCW